MILLRLDNGRISIKDKDRELVRYIPWNCIEMGKIIDPNQVYYHLGKLLSSFPSNDPIKLILPSPHTYSFSYPHQDLNLSECKKIEAHREEIKKLDPKTWKKEVFLGKKRQIVYYDQKTMNTLDEIFKKLGRSYKRLAGLNQKQVQVLCSPEYVYTYNPSKEEGLTFTFSNEAVRFFKDLDMGPDLAYKYLGKTISLDEDEKLDHFLTLFYLENFSNIQDSLEDVSSLAIDQGRYREDASRFYNGPYQDIVFDDRDEDLNLERPSLLTRLAHHPLKAPGKYPVYGLILILLFSAMGLHYRSLRGKLTRDQPALTREETQGQAYGSLFKDLDLSSLKTYDYSYNRDQARLRAQAPSLEAVYHLKKKLEGKGLQLVQEDIQFEDGVYRLDWTIE